MPIRTPTGKIRNVEGCIKETERTIRNKIHQIRSHDTVCFTLDSKEHGTSSEGDDLQ